MNAHYYIMQMKCPHKPKKVGIFAVKSIGHFVATKYDNTNSISIYLQKVHSFW